MDGAFFLCIHLLIPNRPLKPSGIALIAATYKHIHVSWPLISHHTLLFFSNPQGQLGYPDDNMYAALKQKPFLVKESAASSSTCNRPSR